MRFIPFITGQGWVMKYKKSQKNMDIIVIGTKTNQEV